MLSTVSINTIHCGSHEFPANLLDLGSQPQLLYTIGNIELFTRPLVAIVGTRDPTNYGLRTARILASALSNAGVTIVSGMARGIDAAAHYSALENPSSTIAVLGTGVDVPYPVAHRQLHETIGQKGLLISESPPGSRAFKGAFPKRNRIIAALARVTIVVEAGHKSGALNTANHALELNRTIAAVPGPIDSQASAGTNQLIRDGAVVIASVADALALAGVPGPPQPQPLSLSEPDAVVWSTLGGSSLTIDAIGSAAGMSARECMLAVTSLELRGLVECLVSGEVRRR